jgi:signal transduction histidine kinase
MDQKPQILIVDDQSHIRRILERYLAEEGYQLIFAASGPEALETVRASAPDILLLDVMMPGMSGFEVCERLKGDEQWRHIPIILVSALDSKEDLAHGLEVGADDFLSKPVNSLELRARVRSMLRLKQQFDELQSAIRLREDLSNMLVHDMRIPLTYIIGFSQLLLEAGGCIAAEYMEKVTTIYEQAQRLNSFINDMLIVAKMEAGQLMLNRTVVDINQLMEAAAKNHRAIAESKNITLTTALPQLGPRQISLDANLFQRVLDNLLSNALKFSPTGSTVTLRVEYPTPKGLAPTPRMRIEVVDEGPGIAPEDREHIFDKFETARIRQDARSQIGLGLALCKMVVQAHGGHILVKGNEPAGSIFTIEF